MTASAEAGRAISSCLPCAKPGAIHAARRSVAKSLRWWKSEQVPL